MGEPSSWTQAPFLELMARALGGRLAPECLEWSLASRGLGAPTLWFFGLERSPSPAVLWACAVCYNGSLAEVGEARTPIDAELIEAAWERCSLDFGKGVPSTLPTRKYWEELVCLPRWPHGSIDLLAARLDGPWREVALGSELPAQALSLIEAAILRGICARAEDGRAGAGRL